ncbi:putative serine carboxypeptidase CPVL [Haemaphysalis longicornis]
MKVRKCSATLVHLFAGLVICDSGGQQEKVHLPVTPKKGTPWNTGGEQLPAGPATSSSEGEINCDYIYHWPQNDLLLFPTNDRVRPDKLKAMKDSSRVCLPKPYDNLEAYSGFIPADKYATLFLFFLHIKSEHNAPRKPLLLWLQGGPGKSSLFGQFLENGPVGIDAYSRLYRRNHSLTNNFNVIYLDQPVGSGFSFRVENGEDYPKTLEEASIHVTRFLKRFLRLFPEYTDADFYIAGESYGARSAVGVAQRVLAPHPKELRLNFKGVMLGAGFLFPLLDIINSAEYLYYSGLLDQHGRDIFNNQFRTIERLVKEQNFTSAATLLSKTVLNWYAPKEKSLFQKLTGFDHHGSIAAPQRPAEIEAYYRYADTNDFKLILHVNPFRTLDATRAETVMRLAVGDFFVDIQEIVEYVLNRTHVLFYAAQFDAVFPAVNLERCLDKLNWKGKELLKKTQRKRWHREDNTSLELLGYEKIADQFMHNTVLFGGHYIFMDRSSAISELYRRFLKFSKRTDPHGGQSTPVSAC